MQDAIVGTFVIGVLLFIFFVPTSWIIYRNTNFRKPLRLIFSLSVVPLFIFLMAKNYFFIADHFPRLIDLYSSIPDAQKSRQGGLIITFILTCPLSFFGCYVWYKILYLLGKRIYKNNFNNESEIVKQSNEETIKKIKFFETKWMGYFIISLLLTLFVGFEFMTFLERSGRPISTVGMVAVLATLPILTIVLCIKKRSALIKQMYNQADAPGDKAPR